jgi:ABC-type methionine transport system ATPase subunit
MAGGEPLVSLRGVRKDYHDLRPLRIEHLELREADTVALLGVDRAAAEVLVNLISAATLPDAGDVEVFGAPTAAVADAGAWFRLLDRIGIFSERVVLLEELTVEQNLALPLTLDVERLSADVRGQVDALGAEIGLAPETMRQPMAAADQAVRARVRLGKALALEPRVLLAEHPTAALRPADAPRFAADLSGIAARRRLAMLVLTADAGFAAAACNRLLSLHPATGALVARSGWWSRFTRRGR